MASMVLLALTGSVMAPSVTRAGAAGTGAASASAALVVSPSTGLIDNQVVSVMVTGASAGTTYVAVECDPTAFTLLAKGESPADACEARHNAVITVDGGGVAASTLQPQAILTTSLGAADCRQVQCFITVEALYSTGGPSLLVQNIAYAASACSAAGSCTTPDDAWDPTLGVPPVGPAQRLTGTVASPRSRSRGTAHLRRSNLSAVPGTPVTVAVTAGQAGDLTSPGAVTGPYRSAFPAPVVPTTRWPVTVAAVGIVRPGHLLGRRQPSSTVVDVALTDLTTSVTVNTQQFVLYAGPTTFVGGSPAR